MPELFKFIEQLKPHIPPSGIPATERDEIWLLDNTAFRSSPNDPWTAEFVSAYFHHNSEARTKISAAISILMHELGYAPDDKETEERIRTRLAPLMRSIASNMTVDVVFEPNHAGGGQLHLGPSDGNGISSQLFTVPVLDPETGKTPLPGTGPITMTVARSELEGAEQKSDTAILETGRLFLAEDGGFGLISDLDDTAKISCVNNHTELIKNTFANVPQHSPGLPEVYRAIRDAVSSQLHPSPFFYISASPYNLYPFLRKFLMDTKYPDGMIILRDMSWHDIHSWYSRHDDSVLHAIPVKDYKLDRFRKVSSWLPNTAWVCFGDSTQSDPEAYAQFYQELVDLQNASATAPAPDTPGTVQTKGPRTGRVARIFIRKVVGVNPKLEEKLNAPERFEKAFAKVPRDVWKVFEDGSEIMDEVPKIKEEREAISRIHAEERAKAGTSARTPSDIPMSVNPEAGHESLQKRLVDGFHKLLGKD